MKVGLIITGTAASVGTYSQFIEAERKGILTLGPVYTLTKKARSFNSSYFKILFRKKKYKILLSILFTKILLRCEDFLVASRYSKTATSNLLIDPQLDSRVVSVETFSSEYFDFHDDLDLVVVHSSRFIPTAVLKKFKCPVIGAHPGPVSLYRGSHSAIHAYANGDCRIGYSIFTLSSVVDGGSLHFEECLEDFPRTSFDRLNKYLNLASYDRLILLIDSCYNFGSVTEDNKNLGMIYDYPGPITLCNALIQKWSPRSSKTNKRWSRYFGHWLK
jgi:hypothetical protein